MTSKKASGKAGTSEIDGTLWEIKQSIDQLGFDVSQGKYPSSLLRDIKHAVDDLRLTLWGILEMNSGNQEKETGGASVSVRHKLAEFRMKRVERMLTDLRMDLTKGGMPGSESDLKTLTASLQATLHSIDRVTRQKA